MSASNATADSPLETFLREFVDQCGGVCDQIEPQVYDLLLPPGELDADFDTGGRELLRVAFDPEALAEHPGAHLAGFGTPLIDRLLASVARRGRMARAFLNGLNLTPHGLAGRIERALTLPEKIELELSAARPLFFPIAVFWFEATFVSDQKEHDILPIGFDLHYARQVRHLDRLLESAALSDQPDMFLPDVKHALPAEILPLARQQVTRTLITLANARSRELNQRVERQIARMQTYYRDMQSELDDQQHRSEVRGAAVEKYAPRREALQREQRLRVAELRQKSRLSVHLRLAHLLLIRQAKLRIEGRLVSERGREHPLGLVWDPFLETLEAIPCPGCQTPTFVFVTGRQNRLNCPHCV